MIQQKQTSSQSSRCHFIPCFFMTLHEKIAEYAQTWHYGTIRDVAGFLHARPIMQRHALARCFEKICATPRVFLKRETNEWVNAVAHEDPRALGDAVLSVRRTRRNIFLWACGNGHLDVAQWMLSVEPSIDVRAFNDYAFRQNNTSLPVGVQSWRSRNGTLVASS